MTALLSAVVVLAGCGGLPGAGPVQRGQGVDAPQVEQVRVFPDGPALGAGPAEIVRGFFRAAADGSSDDDYQVARSFFTGPAAPAWRPGAEVTVLQESSLQVAAPAPETVQVHATAVASIDAGGRYHDLARPHPVSVELQLLKVGGQWRISGAPPDLGLWVTALDLQRLYRPFAIYYVSPPPDHTLIPDVRWLSVGSGLATTLARAQLSPVPDYLRGAAVSGATAARLNVAAVPVVSGVATVDLTPSSLQADPDLRRAIWAQFIATLLQVPEVFQVALTVGGTKVELPDLSTIPSSVAQLGYPSFDPIASRAVLRVGTTLRRIDPERFSATDEPKELKASGEPLPEIPTAWAALALSPSGTAVAGVSSDRAELALWNARTMRRVARFGTSLTTPSYDGRGRVWVAGSSGGRSRVWSFDATAATGGPRVVQAPWLSGRRVLSLRVAPDDQRAVLVTSNASGGDVQVQLSGIVREGGTDGGVPLSLTVPLRQAASLTDARDAAWVDARTLVVLGRVGARDPLRPYVVGIGSNLQALPPVPAARSVTTTGGARGIVVVSDRGGIYTRAGSGWVVDAKGSDLLVAGA